MTHPAKFREIRGGVIIDTATGGEVVAINVEGLETRIAHRVAAAVIDGLHREFGPRPTPSENEGA